jgi:threonine dehydrogenase-like Zn-dependent dehydrogenase
VLGIINHDGCMAEWVVLPARNLLLVPASLGDELAVFCEPLAAACRILEQGLLQQDSSQQVAVVGGHNPQCRVGLYSTLSCTSDAVGRLCTS